MEVLGRFIHEAINWLERAEREEREGNISDDRFAKGVQNVIPSFIAIFWPEADVLLSCADSTPLLSNSLLWTQLLTQTLPKWPISPFVTHDLKKPTLSIALSPLLGSKGLALRLCHIVLLSVPALTVPPYYIFSLPTTFKLFGWQSLTHLIHSLFLSTLAISAIGRLTSKKIKNEQTTNIYALWPKRGVGSGFGCEESIGIGGGGGEWWLQRVSWSSDMTIMLTMCRLLDYLLSFLCMYAIFSMSTFQWFLPLSSCSLFPSLACPASFCWSHLVLPVKFYSALLHPMLDTTPLYARFKLSKCGLSLYPSSFLGLSLVRCLPRMETQIHQTKHIHIHLYTIP